MNVCFWDSSLQYPKTVIHFPKYNKTKIFYSGKQRKITKTILSDNRKCSYTKKSELIKKKGENNGRKNRKKNS